MAHNAETNRYRSLGGEQRVAALTALRSGAGLDAAAEAAGVSKAALSQASQRDSELRGALDQVPTRFQEMSRKVDFLHALVRTCGDRDLAAYICSLDLEQVQEWGERDTHYKKTEEAITTWMRETLLRELWADPALTGSEIAERLGVSIDVVYAWRMRLGLPRRASRSAGAEAWEPTPEQAELLRELWADPALTGSEIAERLGTNASIVYNWRVRLGLPPRPRRRGLTIAPEVERKLRELWADPSLSGPEIGRRLGVSPGTVYDWRRRLGLPKRTRLARG